VVFPDQNPQSVSPSERAILERLQARRQELEQRAREIEIRESLLKSAEKRIEGRVEEMKATEARISTASGQKAEQDAARFKGIITMYEGMKPKDAAKVFDRLEMSVLYEIASQIAPRKMSDILGLMQPEAAERLTVELARRAGADKSAPVAELPKIEGKILQQKPN
jgi:flagellar motility protein MotE (MotC chaperone)